jgi:hypothetical protein
LRLQVVQLLKGELEGEVLGKTGCVPSQLLVQPFRLHPVEGSEIRIENDPMITQDKDGALDAFNKNHVLVRVPPHAQLVGHNALV